jgi:hypothetical protein
MSEAGEGVAARHEARRHAGEQRRERDNIVPPPSPQEHADGRDEDRKNCCLVVCHG